MTLDPLHLTLLVLFAAAAGFALWLALRPRPDQAALSADLAREREERAALKAERDEQRARAEAAERQLEGLAARMAEREAGLAREREHLARLQAESEERFKALAEAALLKSQQQFVAIADETLKKHKEGAEGELGKMLKPIQETFGQFREKVEAIQKERAEDRAKLAEQIKLVGETVNQTREAATKLQGALTSTRGAGRWGEETLRNVLEMAGLSAHCDFTEQTSASTEAGRIRPDVVIAMPGGRNLVIDSKVSLDDYLAACDETDSARRRQRMMAHAARVKAHVTALSRKDYWKEIPATVDFVVMFIPGENFYAAVLEHDRDIFDYAWRNNVMIATPSTLIALAKSVAFGWRQEQMAKNAEQAARLGRDLYERLFKMSEHMANVGANLGKATKSYNDLVGSMEARVLPAARKFEELQFADPGKLIEPPGQVELAPRQLTLLGGADGEPPKALDPAKSKARSSAG